MQTILGMNVIIPKILMRIAFGKNLGGKNKTFV